MYNARDSYLEGMVLGADPLNLVSMIYGSAVQNIQNARRSLQEGDIEARNRAANKVFEALGLLTSSLNIEEGGQVGENLLSLYLYMQRRLLEANATKSDQQFAEVEELLTTLRSSWAELAANPSLAAA